VDLGAAPGGWTQVAAKRVNAGGLFEAQAPAGRVVAIDVLAMGAVSGCHVLRGDMTVPGTALVMVAVCVASVANSLLSNVLYLRSSQRSSDRSSIC